MAPEVVLGCQYNEQADCFSLGCILFQLYVRFLPVECPAAYQEYIDWQARHRMVTTTSPLAVQEKVFTIEEGPHLSISCLQTSLALKVCERFCLTVPI